MALNEVHSRFYLGNNFLEFFLSDMYLTCRGKIILRSKGEGSPNSQPKIYFWLATTWEGGHVGGVLVFNTTEFFSKNLHDVRCKPAIEVVN